MARVLVLLGLVIACDAGPITNGRTVPIAPSSTPMMIAPFAPSSNCDLVVVANDIYWLENYTRDAPNARGDPALMCDEAKGALRRVTRNGFIYSTPVELDYWPFGLTRAGSSLYWTGAPCHGRTASTNDPSWLWRWSDSEKTPTVVGPTDRHYLGIVASEQDVYVTDRFGRGGAVRFRDGREPAEIAIGEGAPEWLVAVDHRMYWTDATWMLWSRDIDDDQPRQLAALGAMPEEAHVVRDMLVVRTTKAVLVLSTRDGRVLHRIALPEFGDRGAGALSGDAYFVANGEAGLTRIDVTTGIVTPLAVGGGTACGVAVDGPFMYWADRDRNRVFAWRTSAFDQP